MLPLLVVVSGNGPMTSKVSTQLMRRLCHRGLRVRILRTPLERLTLDGDIVVVPCRLKEVGKLAEQLEQEWTETWLAWYSTHNHSPKKGK